VCVIGWLAQVAVFYVLTQLVRPAA